MKTEAKHTRTPNLDELYELTERLRILLIDAEPGLFTWRETLYETVSRIGAFDPVRTGLLEACRKALTCASINSDVALLLRAAIAKAEGGAA